MNSPTGVEYSRSGKHPATGITLQNFLSNLCIQYSTSTLTMNVICLLCPNMLSASEIIAMYLSLAKRKDMFLLPNGMYIAMISGGDEYW